MKNLFLFLSILCWGFALFCYTLKFVYLGSIALFPAIIFSCMYYNRCGILRIGGFSWKQEDFCRGWLITGTTGSGKTVSGINNMLNQITENCPKWGGLCIDEKGLFWENLQKIFKNNGRENDLILLQVKPESASNEWGPKYTFNFLDVPYISLSAKAKIAVDVAKSLGQTGSNDGFFSTQAQTHIEWALKAIASVMQFDAKKKTLFSFDGCRKLLVEEKTMQEVLAILRDNKSEETNLIVSHFEDNFLKQPKAQLGGVKGTVHNYLSCWSDPDIQKVFCRDSNFSFKEIDQGKVICISMPQRFSAERRYINTLLKFCYFQHALQRFDKKNKSRENDNLLILWADEAQQILTSEGTMSDYNIVDRLREAKATMIAATQSFNSIVPAMENNHTKAKVFLANMANRITFKAADIESASAISDSIGKRKIRNKNGTYTDEYLVPPEKIRNLKKFKAVVQHCEKGFKVRKIKPLFI